MLTGNKRRVPHLRRAFVFAAKVQYLQSSPSIDNLIRVSSGLARRFAASVCATKLPYFVYVGVPMWQNVQPLLVEHKKAVGIVGDGFTFLGSLILSLEALFKETEWVSKERKRKLVENTPFLKDKSGAVVTDQQIEKKWVDTWSRVSKAGILILTAGFLALLIGRIFSE